MDHPVRHSDVDERHTSQSRRIVRWTGTYIALILLVFGVLIGRVVQLKLNPDPRLPKAVESSTSSRTELARRGHLLDRNGRVIATTTIGYRLFVDPKVVEDISTIASDLARLLRIDAVDIDKKIHKRIDSRYVVVANRLDDSQIDSIRDANIKGVGLEAIPIRHYPNDALAAGVVGLVGVEHTGLAGYEYLFDETLEPTHGKLTYLRDVRRQALWFDPEEYRPGSDGNDVRLSIDLVIQEIAESRLRQAVLEHNAGGARTVVIDVQTGEILAMADVLNPREGWDEFTSDPMRAKDPRLARNRCVTDPYEPGSTFKGFVWSVATEEGLADPDEILDTPDGVPHVTSKGRRIRDAFYYGKSTWRKVLIKSMNSGMAIVAERMSDQLMQSVVDRFGFGRKTYCGLPGESAGIVTSASKWSHYTQTSVAMGHEIAVTPLQMVRAFSVFARDGTIPSLRITAADPTNNEFRLEHRVLSEATVQLTRDVMRQVMTDGSGRKAQSLKYQLFGKSGTAQLPKKEGGGYHEDRYVSSFIAGAPYTNPRIVVVAIMDDPDKNFNGHYGGEISGPIARDIIDATLDYLGVPPDQPDYQGPIASAD
ncbi:MAG: penicillin-binding protein 2 [Planctomycetota bacterium]|nr:penicillin-binding protein 2 [Planctomycetota bacterium]